MKTFALLLIFSGILFVMHGYYEQKISQLEKKKQKVKYKFIPRSDYDEAHFFNSAYKKNNVLFEKPTPYL